MGRTVVTIHYSRCLCCKMQIIIPIWNYCVELRASPWCTMIRVFINNFYFGTVMSRQSSIYAEELGKLLVRV